jgi:STAS-like domain of unknown function (DUF4325)
MTARLRIRDVLRERILVSRESARLLAAPLRQVIDEETPRGPQARREVTVDFEGVEGMAPTFLDEFLGVLESTVGVGSRILFVAQPARLSLKFEAVARSRGLQVTQENGGRWVFEAKSTRPAFDKTDPA